MARTQEPPPDVPAVKVPWTAEMALRVAGAVGLPHDEQVQRIRDTVDEGRLLEPAVDALIADGFPELDDEPAG
mgnify:FL=1